MEVLIDGVSIDLSEIALLPKDEQREILKLLARYERKSAIEAGRKSFLGFVQYMWDDFILGVHHKRIASIFDGILSGEIKRSIINLAPRMTKSEFSSFLLPGCYIGRYPRRKIIQASNTAELAQGFGRRVRDAIESERFQDLYPHVHIKPDSKAAGRWNTNEGGDYFAIGVGGTMTGRGANLMVIDDPHSETEGMMAPYNPKIFDSVYDWYQAGPRQRLQPGGSMLITMTRWGKRDLTGRVLERAKETGSTDEWKVFEFPAILPSGASLWPEFWPVEDLLKTKRDIAPSRWAAQYMQQPTSDLNAIVKRDSWRPWEKKRPPECEFLVQSWDTAYTSKTSSDYSACTTWGVFQHQDPTDAKPSYHAILLHAYRDRVEFPRLKELAKEMYRSMEPDSIIIEAKASGLPLLYELRQAGIPCQDFSPSRGNDKLVRLNSISDLFHNRKVWFWAESEHMRTIDQCIEEIASFPAGDHDDLMDSSVQALMRIKKGAFLGDYQNQDDDEEETYRPARRYY